MIVRAIWMKTCTSAVFHRLQSNNTRHSDLFYFDDLWKTHSCMFYPKCTPKHTSYYLYKYYNYQILLACAIHNNNDDSLGQGCLTWKFRPKISSTSSSEWSNNACRFLIQNNESQQNEVKTSNEISKEFRTKPRCVFKVLNIKGNILLSH